MKKHLITFVLLTLCMTSFAEEQTKVDDQQSEVQQDASKIFKDNYEMLKNSGLQWSENMKEWVVKDVKRAGAWEYKIVTYENRDFEELEKQLNDLGQKRWECFWIDEKQDKIIMFFKKPKISYIRSIPVKQMLELAPEQAQ